MAAQLIPTQEDPFYEQITDLDGTDYLLRFRYVQRSERWTLSIYLPDETPVALGMVIVCNHDLLKRFVIRPGLPRGALIALPKGQDTSPPTLLELGEGKRVELTYVPEADVKAAQVVT